MPQSVAVVGVDPHQQMTEMMFGYCVSQIIRTAAEFSPADHLADESCVTDPPLKGRLVMRPLWFRVCH
jgi:hypothetical protein